MTVAEARAAGLCLRCREIPTVRRFCGICTLKRRKYDRERIVKLKIKGRCTRCKQMAQGRNTLCGLCTEKRRRQNHENSRVRYIRDSRSGICVVCHRVPARPFRVCPACRERQRGYKLRKRC
jgi:hypothetical protein